MVEWQTRSVEGAVPLSGCPGSSPGNGTRDHPFPASVMEDPQKTRRDKTTLYSLMGPKMHRPVSILVTNFDPPLSNRMGMVTPRHSEDKRLASSVFCGKFTGMPVWLVWTGTCFVLRILEGSTPFTGSHGPIH